VTDPQSLPVSGEQRSPRSEAAPLARFGAFELDLATGELRRAGVRVKLQEQPLRLLVFLLERPGALITRDELREQLWPTDFVDFDHSLNTAVRKLRAALDDSADNPRFIETLARRGYRFIAPVAWAGTLPSPGAEDAPRAPLAQAGDPVAPRRRYALVAAGLAVAIMTLVAFVLWRRSPAPAAPAQPAQASAIAVLPFLPENGAAEHLTDGLSEVLMNALSRVTDLRVMGRTTVFRYKGRAFDARQIGRDLKVGAVVTGTVRAQGGEQTIYVELVDTADGTRLWGQRYETAGSSLPAVHSRVAEDLTRRLRRGIDRTAFSQPSTRNPRAYELYLQALQAWNRRTPRELQRATDLLKQAIGLDPEFADAHAALAQTYGVMVGYDLIPAIEGAPLVLSSARAALAIDPSNSDAYVSRASTKFRTLWDFEGAGADYQRALELNPSNVTGHQWYGDYLRVMGRFEEAEAEITRAWELDPQSLAVTSAYCHDARLRRQYDQALDRARHVAGRPRGSHCAVTTLLAMGRYGEALDEIRLGNMVAPDILASLQRGYRENGARGYLLARLDYLRQAPGNSRSAWENSVDIAGTYAALNDREAAFAALEQGLATRTSRMTQIHIEPQFDSLRDDPRFEDLVRRIGISKEALAAADAIRPRATKDTK
jgi:TolB-like protein/DNA-binding winged helix-turn-helix (wHTH) protein